MSNIRFFMGLIEVNSDDKKGFQLDAKTLIQATNQF